MPEMDGRELAVRLAAARADGDEAAAHTRGRTAIFHPLTA